MKLLIDVGNSRIKWACYEHAQLAKLRVRSYERDTLPGQLSSDFQEISVPPEAVLVANVAGPDIAALLTEALARAWSIKPEFVQVEQQRCGVINGYKDISELGVDRWLATLAVWSEHRRAACIVDCGTALTFDVINHKGEYQGGLIIPGPHLMQHSLIDKTAAISAAASEHYARALGLSTAECIANGAGLAATAFIDSMTAAMKREYGEQLCCVLTGGGAAALSGLLENDYRYDPDLVLKGLSRLVDTA